MHGMDVYSFILDLSPKEVLTGQAWRDDGLLKVYDDKGSARVRPGRFAVPWILPVLSDGAMAGNGGASVPAPSICTVLGQRPWWGLRLIVYTCLESALPTFCLLSHPRRKVLLASDRGQRLRQRGGQSAERGRNPLLGRQQHS